MNVTVLRTDGSEESHDVPFRGIAKLIGAEVTDTVDLRDGRVMLVDDLGWVADPPKPINARATELYHAICKPGTTHEIAGDVAIIVDDEVPL